MCEDKRALSCDTPIACDLSALSAAQRERRRKLATKIHSAVGGRRELADGYALRVAQKASVQELRGWADLESKICGKILDGVECRANRSCARHVCSRGTARQKNNDTRTLL